MTTTEDTLIFVHWHKEAGFMTIQGWVTTDREGERTGPWSKTHLVLTGASMTACGKHIAYESELVRDPSRGEVCRACARRLPNNLTEEDDNRATCADDFDHDEGDTIFNLVPLIGPLTRDGAVAAWGDVVLPSLRPRVRAVYAVARFVAVSGSTVRCEMPNVAHAKRADEDRAEVEAALSEHFGRRVILELVTEGSA
jgi:hypothetical protein